MHGSRIVGLGHYLPANVVSSEDIARPLDVDGEWIRSRTGVRTRHLAGTNETVVDLAVHAAKRALASSPADTLPVDTVIVATSTSARMPNAASQVAAQLGVYGAAFDINAACAGFCHALAVADSLITTGAATTVLVVGADRASGSIDWRDRNTASVFGDGAGAAVLGPSDQRGISPIYWGSAGQHGALVTLTDDVIRQQGQAVFRWAIGLGEHLQSVCRRAGIAPDQLAAFVPHQANLRIIDALAATLHAPNAVIARDVIDVGNTMAASIPIALSRMAERGELPSDKPILLFGFGSGLTYAGQIIYLNQSDPPAMNQDHNSCFVEQDVVRPE